MAGCDFRVMLCGARQITKSYKSSNPIIRNFSQYSVADCVFCLY